MSDIAKLYEEVMADSEIEKTASDVSGQDQAFDHEFFEKVASGDESAVEELNEFIEAARQEGYDDDAIEQAIGETMEEVGFEMTGEEIHEEQPAEFELQKAAAYEDGSAKAIEDVLEKAAEFGVSEEDLVDFYLGSSYGEGYAETRQELESAIEKIAEGKMRAGYEGAKKLLSAAGGKVKKGGSRYVQLMRGGKAGAGAKGALSRAKAGESGMETALRSEARRVAAARGLTGLGAAGAVGGTAAAVKSRKK